MKNLESRRVRYLQDAVPVRLGGLAANLSRIASFSQHAGTVSDIMLETRWFIEWTALELEVTKAADLVKLQIQLALWDLESRQHWHMRAGAMNSRPRQKSGCNVFSKCRVY